MSAPGLIDHSPHHPSPSPPVSTASNLVLIDNYDSFTWNVYQYLVLEGATVTVYRNDEITLEQLIEKNPTQLVISPGPGHPKTDAGISNAAIKHFAGKIPILGVCLGEQSIFYVFGGDVDVTGEILHGKTSPLQHDSKGLYAGVPQNLPVTRYHSLAGTHSTVPECLEVTSWVPYGKNEKGIIMGVRHKEYVIEGVQFHPESILTAEGRTMIKNFLRMQGGTWAQNQQSIRTIPSLKQQSILEKIYEHRRASVEAQKQIPSQRPIDLQAAYDLDLSPPQISFPDRLRQTPYRLSLMAEIKRASPSKGIISATACAPAQARVYAKAGASVISVLTEPEWFKGSIEDLRAVRQCLDSIPNRPAVLRKEFIFDEYQILEARLAGADTILLIVKMLEQSTLERLFHYSRSLGMEPLVEVNTVEEMQRAIALGSKVIGVNNRNLTNFEVDLETTSRLMANVPNGTIVCALSGISDSKDVVPYENNGVGAVLVGEALMRASDPAAFISELLGRSEEVSIAKSERRPLVKICGTRSPEAAIAAITAGADLIGMILVQGRKRTVSTEVALSISKAVHATPRPEKVCVVPSASSTSAASDYFDHSLATSLLHPDRALLVGVFQDQPLDYVLTQQKLLNLDVIQFHGSEPIEWSKLVPVPVIKCFKPNQPGLGKRGYHALPLLDSTIGGTGQLLNLDDVRNTLAKDDGLRVMLAGGLDANNVQEVVASLKEVKDRVRALDVSSGVEENGLQNLNKIQSFIAAAKAIVL